MPRAFRHPFVFLRTYFALKKQNVDSDKAAELLGKPKTLELTDEQAGLVKELFCDKAAEPEDVARGFFKVYPRVQFRYFMALTPDEKALEFTNADPALDGVELIQAAMVALREIVQHDDGDWYFQSWVDDAGMRRWYPITRRMFEAGAQQGDLSSLTKKQKLFA